MEKIFFIIGLSMIFAGGVKASEIIGQISTDPSALPNYNNSATTTGRTNEPESPSTPPVSPVILMRETGAAPVGRNELSEGKSEAEKKVLGEKIYPSNSLLRNIDDKIYLVEVGVKKYISNLQELQRYRGRAIYDVKPEELAGYETREHLDGDLIRQRGDVKVYYIKDEKKIHILNLEELRAYFFGLEIFNISAEEMLLY